MAQLTTEPVTVNLHTTTLDGDLAVPSTARSVVLFAHGSGSSRRSPRNRAVAEHLQHSGFGTMLLDLLDAEEAREDQRTQQLRFDTELLADRLVQAIDVMRDWSSTAGMPVGLFGASTGAAAALKAAALRPDRVKAVVSRGGRPDLAGEAIQDVHSPCLLVVGSLDREVLNLNRQAAEWLRSRRLTDVQLSVVPGAGHLFEEEGALEQVGELASGWFRDHLGAGAPNPAGTSGGHFKPPAPRRRPPV
ncbi:dienelactone hydrolase family protein [Salinifilum aidingensis]